MVIAGDTSMIKKKTTQGRKKIEIKKIEDANSRQVTFSKRRVGLFKKASELCVLTGAQMAIFVNSPGGRVYTYGHPDVDVLLDRYLENNDAKANEYAREVVVPRSEFNQHYAEVSRELELEKKRKEMMPTSSESGSMWFEKEVKGMNVDELEEFLYSVMEMKKKVLTRADELIMINKAPGFFGRCNGVE